MNKYEEKVLFRAREMAAICYPKGYKLSEWSKVLGMARLSVLREAEALKEGMLIVDTFLEWKHDDIAAEQIELGLIPPQTETV